MLEGIEATLIDMLNCRERRAQKQQEFLSLYHKPIISFCMNIPGPIKTTPEIHYVFSEGKELISKALSAENIVVLDSIEYNELTGDEWILCIDSDSPSHIKDLMMQIEETHPLGRLFDIDVLDASGVKLSRERFRKCLICDHQAQECASKRVHSVREMQMKIESLLHEYLLNIM